MPRSANICHNVSPFAPAFSTTSAWMIALRMSRNDGLGGDSSIPRVTSRRAVVLGRAWRMSQRVSSQISPSACTSGEPLTPSNVRMLPKSP